MSKSMYVTPRWVMTDWYAACRLDSVVRAIASSVPPSPPRETIGVAPSVLALAEPVGKVLPVPVEVLVGLVAPVPEPEVGEKSSA